MIFRVGASVYRRGSGSLRQVRGGAAERAPRKRKRDTRVRALRRAAPTKRKRKEQEKHPSISGAFCWCGHRDLNSDGVNHTPLKRTRLPVPPWPHSENSILLPSTFVNGFAGVLSRKYRGKTYVKVFCGKGERRGGTSHLGRAFRRLAQGGKRRKRKSRRRVPPTFFETRFTSWRCILQVP